MSRRKLALTLNRLEAVLLRVLLSMGMASLTYSLYYLHSERSFDVVYGVLFSYFSVFSLFWIFPWALVTVSTRGWMTR